MKKKGSVLVFVLALIVFHFSIMRSSNEGDYTGIETCKSISPKR